MAQYIITNVIESCAEKLTKKLAQKKKLVKVIISHMSLSRFRIFTVFTFS